jgi:hypothetical protein
MTNFFESTPQILYKYRSYEGKNKANNYGAMALLNFELFASSPNKFNDPFDNALPFKYKDDSFTLETFIEKYITRYDLRKMGKKNLIELKYEATDRFNYIKNDPEKHWREGADTIYKMDNEFYGILSLSSEPNNILMWSHYADFHKGYCAGIDAHKFATFMATQYKEFGLKLGPVEYSEDHPMIDFVNDLDPSETYKRCFTKNVCWSYEEEFRLVFHNTPNEVIKFPKEIIKAEYIVCKMSDKNRHEIISFIKNSSLDIELYQMKMGFSKFVLEKVPIMYCDL